MKRLTQGRKCAAHRSDGQPCGAPPIRGGTVCRVHGGSAPQVRRKAEERLRALIDPAIVALSQIVQDKAHPQRLAAAREILERDGRIGVVVEADKGGGNTFVLQIVPAGSQTVIEVQPQLEPGIAVRRL